MKTWHHSIDPSTIPDEVITSENARRNSRKRKRHGGGRPPIIKTCAGCGAVGTATEIRQHKCIIVPK